MPPYLGYADKPCDSLHLCARLGHDSLCERGWLLPGLLAGTFLPIRDLLVRLGNPLITFRDSEDQSLCVGIQHLFSQRACFFGSLSKVFNIRRHKLALVASAVNN
jgi:hypothetical protein